MHDGHSTRSQLLFGAIDLERTREREREKRSTMANLGRQVASRHADDDPIAPISPASKMPRRHGRYTLCPWSRLVMLTHSAHAHRPSHDRAAPVLAGEYILYSCVCRWTTLAPEKTSIGWKEQPPCVSTQDCHGAKETESPSRTTLAYSCFPMIEFYRRTPEGIPPLVHAARPGEKIR